MNLATITPSARVTWRKSRRVKRPYDLEVESLDRPMDSDTWWALYRMAVDHGGELAPASIPAKSSSAHCYLFLRLPSRGAAQSLEADIAQHLTESGYAVALEGSK